MMRGLSAARYAPGAARGAWARSSTRRIPSQATSAPRRALRTPDLRNATPSRRLHTPGTTKAETTEDREGQQPTAVVDPLLPLPDRFRTAMRLLTHPVLVLTAHDGAAPRAMTMSSFTTLSVAPPTPLVTFNIATPSQTLDAIVGDPDGHFNLHLLAADGRGARVADHFTRGNSVAGLFDGIEHAAGTGGGDDGRAPVLLGGGVLHVLRCRLASRDAPSGGLVPVRDHVIVVAEVVDMVAGKAGDGFALAYTDRRHRRTGERIDIERG